MKLHVQQNRNILLIDDDEDDSLLLNFALAKLSAQASLVCLTCTDKLWEALDTFKPCLIVIDLHLPKKNGIEILELIKKHPDYKEIPVVIWSTTSMVKHVMAAYRSGAQLYLEKPFDYKELVTALQKVIKMTIPREEPFLFPAIRVSANLHI
jgi:DNA-binding response OmpR family regulator